MADKKLTDEEIIKRLERCVNRGNRNYDTEIVLDLINRQKAEIERLKDLITYQKQEIKEKEQKYNQAVDDMFGLIETTRNEIAEAKSEAIKEFAARLKCGVQQETGVIMCADVDNLVKEMTEV